MNDMDQIVKEFLVESHENLDQLDRDLVHLEESPRDAERVARVGENLLCKLREGELLLTPEITSGLLAMVDAVRQMLANVENTGGEGDAQYGELIELLTRLHGAPATNGSQAAAQAEQSLAQ